MADVDADAPPDEAHRRRRRPPSTTTPRRPADDEPRHHTGLSNNKLAMWVFLGSECLLFGGLISTYMLYRGRTPASPGPDQVYDIPFTSVSSFVLLMSSLTMVLAVVGRPARRRPPHPAVAVRHRAARRARSSAARSTSSRPSTARAWASPPACSASSFYTLTGFHGVHVTVGIIMLLSLVVMSSAGRIAGDKAEVVEIVGLYWHFVDIVWIVIFTLVYLIPA